MRSGSLRARGVTVTRWYFEAMSGKTRDRPELKALLEDARRGEINKLWVFRLDRLTRSGIRDTLNLLEELVSSGCQVISVADGFALDGPFSDVVLAVIAWAAQMERAATGDRIAAARVRVEAAGRTWGRPIRLLSLEVGQKIRALAADKVPIRMIAQTVRVPKSTVQRFLARSK
jgi:DNA invertase Pin-like site-specific DNA recombinase